MTIMRLIAIKSFNRLTAVVLTFKKDETQGTEMKKKNNVRSRDVFFKS